MYMDKKRIKDALYSILIGAIVAFLSSFIDGIADLIQGWGDGIAGGATTTITYLGRVINKK